MNNRSMLVAVSAALLLAACEPGKVFSGSPSTETPRGNPLEGLQAIRLLPADATVAIDGSTPARQSCQATGTFADGHTEDITDRVVWSTREVTLGSFTGNVFTTTTERGGLATLQATAGGVSGTTGLSIKLGRTATDEKSADVPSDAAARFAGTADAGRKPELVYPNDGVLLPPNLPQVEIHFLPGAGNTLFEITFENTFTSVKVHAGCATPLNGGCIYVPSAQVWRWIADTNRGGLPIKITVRGTGAQAGSTVGTSDPINLSLSLDDLQGGIYYFSTSNPPAIMRYDFSTGKASVAEKFVGNEASGGNCVGCHSLSHTGERMVVAGGSPGRGILMLMDVARSQPMVAWGQAQGRSLFESWSPDDKRFVGVWGELDSQNFNLLLFDGVTTALTGSIEVGGTAQHPATHPDWSPDGKHIAFTHIGEPMLRDGRPRIQETWGGAIEMVTQQAGDTWSAPRMLVPAVDGANHYYPTFAPDNSFIVFNESHCPNGVKNADCDTESDPSARLWALDLGEGAKPVELARANAPGRMDNGETDLASSYPRWSPFSFARSGEFGAKLNWLSFSSRRTYGLHKPPPSTDGPGIRGQLLWMTGVDPTRVAAGQDPSSPAFALPMQDINTSNHLAQWTVRVVPSVQ